jgi:hypothetical protein
MVSFEARLSRLEVRVTQFETRSELGKALEFLLRSSPKVSLVAGEVKSALKCLGGCGQTNGGSTVNTGGPPIATTGMAQSARIYPFRLGVHPALQLAYPAPGTGAYPTLWNTGQ